MYIYIYIYSKKCLHFSLKSNLFLHTDCQTSAVLAPITGAACHLILGYFGTNKTWLKRGRTKNQTQFFHFQCVPICSNQQWITLLCFHGSNRHVHVLSLTFSLLCFPWNKSFENRLRLHVPRYFIATSTGVDVESPCGKPIWKAQPSRGQWCSSDFPNVSQVIHETCTFQIKNLVN